MGWDEVLDITPGMFIALMNRRAYRDATWIATYANLKRGKGDPAITPEQLLNKRPAQAGTGPGVFAAFQKAFADA